MLVDALNRVFNDRVSFHFFLGAFEDEVDFFLILAGGIVFSAD
jgi:hypothetical protein